MISTRGDASASLDEAFLLGIAGDGGLFLPESLPAFSATHFDDADDICGTAVTLLRPFFAGSMLGNQLAEIVTETFWFPIPVTPVADERGAFNLLELYHGPTAAFKDVGAGFLAACISRLNDSLERPLTILVATSGDTGGAVAAAFDGRAGTRVVVLFPEGRVSQRQQHQLCCWGDNVLSLSVKGSFDDCQAMVKAAMGDAGLAARHRFSSANSINIGRLLPQCIYYAHTSLRHFRQGGRQASFVVPTGNLGNAFACIMAREMGLPIAEIVLATNANRTIADFLDGGEWTPRAEHCDTRLGDGCRQSEQYGAIAKISWRRGAAEKDGRLRRCRRCTNRRRNSAELSGARHDCLPAYCDCELGIATPRSRDSTGQRLVCRRYRASGQIRADCRAADSEKCPVAGRPERHFVAPGRNDKSRADTRRTI